jgi:hypothetical protein
VLRTEKKATRQGWCSESLSQICVAIRQLVWKVRGGSSRKQDALLLTSVRLVPPPPPPQPTTIASFPFSAFSSFTHSLYQSCPSPPVLPHSASANPPIPQRRRGGKLVRREREWRGEEQSGESGLCCSSCIKCQLDRERTKGQRGKTHAEGKRIITSLSAPMPPFGASFATDTTSTSPTPPGPPIVPYHSLKILSTSWSVVRRSTVGS